MRWDYTDGGRRLAGFSGASGDCVVRAIAVATRRPYLEVYDAINVIAKAERAGKQGRRSSARNGVYRRTYDKYLRQLGWAWTPTMGIGTGCRVHLREEELPSGRLIVRLSKHITAVVDGVIQDTGDPSRGGTRCVYGYWARPLTPTTGGAK